jgi:hypothetical protein
MDTVGIRASASQTSKCFTFSVSSALRHSPSAKCVTADNDICRFLVISGKNDVSFEDTFSMR